MELSVAVIVDHFGDELKNVADALGGKYSVSSFTVCFPTRSSVCVCVCAPLILSFVGSHAKNTGTGNMDAFIYMLYTWCIDLIKKTEDSGKMRTRSKPDCARTTEETFATWMHMFFLFL